MSNASERRKVEDILHGKLVMLARTGISNRQWDMIFDLMSWSHEEGRIDREAEILNSRFLTIQEDKADEHTDSMRRKSKSMH